MIEIPSSCATATNCCASSSLAEFAETFKSMFHCSACWPLEKLLTLRFPVLSTIKIVPSSILCQKTNCSSNSSVTPASIKLLVSAEMLGRKPVRGNSKNARIKQTPRFISHSKTHLDMKQTDKSVINQPCETISSIIFLVFFRRLHLSSLDFKRC